MKTKLKVLSYYISMILLSVMVLGLSGVTLLKYTVLDEDYLIKHLEKNNYYDKLYDSIGIEMSYYIIQSGLEDEVLENIYTKEMVKSSVNDLVISFYNGKDMVIETSKVGENLNDNIQNYLLKNNIVATDEKALNLFIEQMVNVYDEEIRLSKDIEKVQDKFIKFDKLIDNLFIVLIIIIPLFGLFCHFFYKRIVFTMPCISSSILLFLGEWLFYNRIDVKNILFWGENVSSIIKSILWDISDFIVNEAIILIVVGVITFIVGYITTSSMSRTKSSDEMKIKSNDGSYREFSKDGYRSYSEVKLKKNVDVEEKKEENVPVIKKDSKTKIIIKKIFVRIKKVLIYIKKLLLKWARLLRKSIGNLIVKYSKKKQNKVKVKVKKKKNIIIDNIVDDKDKVIETKSISTDVSKEVKNAVDSKVETDKKDNDTNMDNKKNTNSEPMKRVKYDYQIIMDDGYYKKKKRSIFKNPTKSENEINFNNNVKEEDMVDELFGYTYGTFTTEYRKNNNRFDNKKKYNNDTSYVKNTSNTNGNSSNKDNDNNNNDNNNNFNKKKYNNYKKKPYYKNNYYNGNNKKKDFNNTKKQDTK